MVGARVKLLLLSCCPFVVVFFFVFFYTGKDDLYSRLPFIHGAQHILETWREPSSSPPSVIIVGAGMSGISAAKKLHDAGINDFLILEATNRMGGRIHKTNFEGYTIEMGANWLHGVGGRKINPLYEISRQIHLKKYFSDFSNVSLNTYKQEGGFYTRDEVEDALAKAQDTKDFGENFSKKLLNNEKANNDDMSILDLERLHKTLRASNNFVEELPMSIRVPKTSLERMIDFYTFDGEQAEAPRVTSLKHVIPMAELHDFGENSYFVADTRGFESLVHHIAQQYLSNKNDVVNDPRIKFNKVVREVDQSQGGITVTTEDGKSYQAKIVILSPSLGVLQSDLISFNPPLPEWKRRAISEFSIGIFTKIFLKFPQKFWPSGNGTEFFFYAHQRRGYYSMWKHMENEYPGSNILLVILADDESIRVEEQSDEETKTEAMEVLRKMFGDHIPEATHIMIPRRKSDRFYQGCFTNWPIGYSQERHNELRAPIGGIYFTGEHTHPRYFGYADGAFYAGAGTGNDVIRCLKKNICKGPKR